MGYLTDPNTGQGKFTKLLLRAGTQLCILSYLAGIIWFLCLAHRPFNNATYFSENALLPGLVRGEFSEELTAQKTYEELKTIMKDNPTSIPYSWLRGQFSQLHMDSYLHNFSVNLPLGKGSFYSGQNIYAILRAPRASSLEGLVVSAPFRLPSSIHPDNSAGIALLLAIAKFARRQKYWAKDIVFLITDHEQLGAQAWLEAYHGVRLGSNVLDPGEIPARAGALQAAVNLELHGPRISHIDVKIEGLNGQLPNLDLVNLVHRLCSKEGVRHTFQNRSNPRKRDSPFEQWQHSMTTLLRMVFNQASCVPFGNHGLFHRFGVEAVTLEGYEVPANYRLQIAGLYQTGRVLEGILRSLNNLLERFHQSFFFYLLTSNDRFISIGVYMPAFALVGAPLLIRSLVLWLEMYSAIRDQATSKDNIPSIRAYKLGVTWLLAHTMGLIFLYLPGPLSRFISFNTPTSIYLIHFVLTLITFIIPFVVSLNSSEGTLLSIIVLIELATFYLTIVMHNFSLAFLWAAVAVPVVLIVGSRRYRFLQMFLLLLINPFIGLHLIVGIYSWFSLNSSDWLIQAFYATQNSLVFGLVDKWLYGNWLIEAVFAFFMPCCIMFSTLLCYSKLSTCSNDDDHDKQD